MWLRAWGITRKPIIFLVGSVCLASILVDQAIGQTQISRTQVRQDATQIETLLLRFHPNLYAHRSPAELKKIWRRVKSDIPNKPNVMDAAIAFQKILASVCDEHTGLRVNDIRKVTKHDYERYFPLNLVVVGNELFVDDFSFNSKPKKVVSINSRSAEEIVELLRSIATADGCQKSHVLFTSQLPDFPVASLLLTKFLGSETEFDLAYQDGSTADVSRSSLAAINWRTLSLPGRRTTRGRAAPLQSLGIDVSEIELNYATNSKEQILVRSNSDESIFYVYVPSFYGGEEQNAAVDVLMQDLVSKAPKEVIIDLTENPGGSIVGSQRFLSYFLNSSSKIGAFWRSRIAKEITDPSYFWFSDESRKIHRSEVEIFSRKAIKNGQYKVRASSRSFGNQSYDGNLTVLVSPRSDSAAIFVASTLKSERGARIVGDVGDVSMKTACAAAPGSHLLPNTRLRITIPLVCYDRREKDQSKGNLIPSDVPVDISTANSRMTNINILNAAVREIEVRSNNSTSEQIAKPPAIERVNVKLGERPDGGKTGWVGAGFFDLYDLDSIFPQLGSGRHLFVTAIQKNSPGQAAGLYTGNIIRSVGDVSVDSAKEAISAIGANRPGENITLEVMRTSKTISEFIEQLRMHSNDESNHGAAAYALGVLNQYSDYDQLTPDAQFGYEDDLQASIRKSWDRAFDWYKLSADQGNVRAMGRIATVLGGVGSEPEQPEVSALYFLHALQKSDRQYFDALFRTAYSFGYNTRVEIQKNLKELDLLQGSINGQIGSELTTTALVRLRNLKTKLPNLPPLDAE